MIKTFAAFLLCFAFALNSPVAAQESGSGVVTILYSPGHPVNTFIPSQTLGAGIDGQEKGETAQIFQPKNIQRMLSAGFKPLTYRLRTELGDEAWHWNPKGTWSDPAHKQGYWTSSSTPQAPIITSYGYKLPRRGNTIDQANDDGYSRLDDGDPTTFWKSNPYLDSHFTNETESNHPQWVIVDLGKETDVDAIRIAWGLPFALNYQVDYGGDIGNDYFGPERRNFWQPFSKGSVANPTSAERTIKISDAPVKARFVRVSMTKSSHTIAASENQTDVRNKSGFAIREIYVGMLGENGNFSDAVHHSPGQAGQSTMYVSSTDSWHRAKDLDKRVEQPGIDLIYKSGLSNNLPVLFPVGVIYDSPDNAAALVSYLNAKHYRLEEIEIGEEPDRIEPEDYAALYIIWAQAMRRNFPSLRLGGPSFATITPFEKNPDIFTEKQWLTRFLAYLKSRGQLDTFNFFSFEWYPFDNVCAPAAPQLADASRLLTLSFNGLREILPPGVPIWITEYGYSAFAGETEVSIEGALFNADIVGRFLTLGGERAYLYGYEPNEIISELPCSWGNNMLFVRGNDGRIKFSTAAYYGARMLTQSWAQPAGEKLQIFPAESDILNENKEQMITAYALRRPDNKWSLMLINKDPQREWKVKLKILNSANGETSPLNFPAEVRQFSKAQYQWQAAETKGHPVPNSPPLRMMIPETGNRELRLPPYSLTVVKEL